MFYVTQNTMASMAINIENYLWGFFNPLLHTSSWNPVSIFTLTAYLNLEPHSRCSGFRCNWQLLIAQWNLGQACILYYPEAVISLTTTPPWEWNFKRFVKTHAHTHNTTTKTTLYPTIDLLIF